MIDDPIESRVATAFSLGPQGEPGPAMADEMRHAEAPEPALERLRARGIDERRRLALDHRLLQSPEQVVRLRERETEIGVAGLQVGPDRQVSELTADQTRRRLARQLAEDRALLRECD
jgi:hypothetical protein